MSGRYAQGSIAGVELVGPSNEKCRIDVLDGEALKGTLTGSSATALDFTVHTQLSARGAKSIHWGVQVSYLPIVKLNAIVAAIATAMAEDSDFSVEMADAGASANKADDINVSCVPDFQQMKGSYYTRGRLDGEYVRDTVFRFITTG